MINSPALEVADPDVIVLEDYSVSSEATTQGLDDEATPVALDVAEFNPGAEYRGRGVDLEKLCIKELCRYPVVGRAEELVLVERLRGGDESVREKMLLGNMRLVVKMAYENKGFGLAVWDLVSVGLIGLRKAVEGFDPAKGDHLASYAGPIINTEMQRELAYQARNVGIPAFRRDQLTALSNAEVRLREEFGRRASDAELGKELGVKEKKVKELKRYRTQDKYVSFDEESYEGLALKETLADAKAADPVNRADMNLKLERLPYALESLDPRRREIIGDSFYFEGRKKPRDQDLAPKHGVSPARIGQLRDTAIRKLREFLEGSAAA